MDEDMENYMEESDEPLDCETEASSSDRNQAVMCPPIVPVGDPEKPKPKKPVKP